MAEPKLRGVLLCEDVEHERFFRALLKKWFAPSKLRVNRIPNQGGAGDAWVTKNFAREVRYVRSKGDENVALVVAIDGDRRKIEHRLRLLDHILSENDLARRGAEEKIAIFVPTRNIETWELWLCGERDLDEVQDYKFRWQHHAASAKTAAQAWFENLSFEDQQLEEKLLPALSAGRRELEARIRQSKQ